MVGSGPVCLFLPSLLACAPKASYEGKYAAVDPGAANPPEISIELKSNGQGIWQVQNDQADFTWSVRGAEIRLHLKSGGVISGRIVNSTIVMKLPEPGVITFHKLN